MNDTEMDAANFTQQYCGQGMERFHDGFQQVHAYLSVLVCVFGSVANSLNIAVLTRREMVSPTNAILTGLALADLLVMVEYIPFLFYDVWPYTDRSLRVKYTYPWAYFTIFHAVFAQVCHTIAIFLTVTLAVWRYIAIAHPQVNARWCNMRVTIITIAAAWVLSPLICLPIPFSLITSEKEMLLTAEGHSTDKIQNISLLDPPAQNATLVFVGFGANESLNSAIFYIYSVVIKLIPCIALTILSSQLIMVLLETKKRRQQLMAGGREGAEGAAAKARRRSERQTDRTTRMLLAVLCLFLLTEFPQAIMGLLSLCLGKPFIDQCYSKLGELMDFMALVNSAINFILYCTMSRQFRTTFAQLFRPKVLGRWLPVPLREAGGPGETDANGLNGDKTQMTQV